MSEPMSAPSPAGTSLPWWIPTRKTTIIAIVVLIVLSLSYLVNAADRQVFPVLLAEIAKKYGFRLSDAGLLSTIFTLGIGIGGLPAGRLLDRMPRKTTMLVGIGIYSLFTMLTPLSAGFGDMAVYRTLTGIGEAMQNAALFAAMGAYFYTRRALALGAVSIAYGAGGALGPWVGARIASSNSWPLVFYTFGLAGFAFLLVILLFINRRFTEAKDTVRDTAVASDAEQRLPGTLLNRTTIFLSLTCAMGGFCLYSVLGLYPTYLQNVLHFTLNDAGWAATWFGIGSMIMCIPAGLLGDRFGYRIVTQAGFVLAFVSAVLMFTVAKTPLEQYTLSAAEGAMGSGIVYVNMYAAMQHSVRPSLVGQASGAFVTFWFLPSAAAGYIFGDLVGWWGWSWAAVAQLGFFPLLGITFLALARLSPPRAAGPLRAAVPATAPGVAGLSEGGAQ